MSATVFSSQLQSLRKQHGVTQEQLALHLGVSPQAVSKWENGSYPDGDLLPKIADFFGVSIDFLYGREKGSVSVEQRMIDELHAAETNDSSFHKKFIKKMFDMIWAMQIATWRENKTWYDMPEYGAESMITVSTLLSNDGFSFLRMNSDLRYYFIAETPDEGFAARLNDLGAFAELFAFLGDKINLKVLMCRMSLKNNEYVRVSTVADSLQIPVEKARSALSKLSKFGEDGGAAFPECSILNEKFDPEPCYGKIGYRSSVFIMLLIAAETVLNEPKSYQLQVCDSTDWIDREKLDFLKKQQ